MLEYQIVPQRWWEVIENAPEETLDHYVYVWFMKVPGLPDQPFYVGSGCKNRWKRKSNRNRGFKKVCAHHEVYSKKMLENVTKELSWVVEIKLKELYKSLGYEIMDGEDYHSKQKQRWTRAAKREIRAKDPTYKEGRKPLPPETVEKILQGVSAEELGIGKSTWYKYRRMNKN